MSQSQSDAHSVSSSRSTASSVQPQQLSVPIAVVPPPSTTITPRNPFDSLSTAPVPQQSSTTSAGMIAGPGTTTANHTAPVPSNHVPIRMQQQQHPHAHAPLPQHTSPLRPIGTTASTTGTKPMLSSSTPPPTVRTTLSTSSVMSGAQSQSQYPSSTIPMQMSSTPSIPSPVSHPNSSPQDYNQPSNSSTYTQYTLFDPSHQQAPMTWPQTAANTNNTVQNDLIFDDDENTAPSSLGNTTDDQSSQPYHNRQYGGNRTSNVGQRLDPDSFPTTIGSSSLTSRIIESTKRFISASTSGHDLNPDPDPAATTTTMTTTTTPILTASNTSSQASCLISGYLQKFGRNGKWQTRWFETNGIYLSYYKSSKRSKLLATLDLQKVGAIEMDPDDKTEHSFKIQVLGRSYQLRANSRASCQDWVITLNRVKEARLQQGNVKLAGLPTNKAALDLLSPSKVAGTSNSTSAALKHKGTDTFMDDTPRVVVVSNRERTHGVDEDEQWEELIRIDDGQNIVHTTGGATTLNETDIDPAGGGQVETIYGSNASSNKRLSSIGTVVAARWTKHHSALQRLGTKLSKWARSIKKYSCTDADAVMNSRPHQQSYGDVVHLDKYLHPPGHDDKLIKQQQQRSKVVISDSSTAAAPNIPVLPMNTTGLSSVTSSSGGVIHHNPVAAQPTNASGPLATSTSAAASAMDKPLPIADRCLSTASDYDVRMLS